jgi:glutathione S-transferase
MAFVIPEDYRYVVAAAASTTLANLTHFFLTSRARKAAAIPYPTTYASDDVAKPGTAAYKFNCAQRAHANFTENHTGALTSMLVAGIAFPNAAAVLGGLFTIGRIAYAVGYVSKGPEGRF